MQIRLYERKGSWECDHKTQLVLSSVTRRLCSFPVVFRMRHLCSASSPSTSIMKAATRAGATAGLLRAGPSIARISVDRIRSVAVGRSLIKLSCITRSGMTTSWCKGRLVRASAAHIRGYMKPQTRPHQELTHMSARTAEDRTSLKPGCQTTTKIVICYVSSV